MKIHFNKGLIYIALISWMSMLAFDFFLHGGLLAESYQQGDSFLLSPKEAFRRIPLGYLSFLILAFLLTWLMDRLAVSGGRQGWRFGLTLGLIFWGSFGLGLYSISTIRWQLLLGWWLGQAVELGIAGWLVGKALAGTMIRRLLWWVVGMMALSIALTVILQNL